MYKKLPGSDEKPNLNLRLKSHCTRRNLLRRSADDGKRLSIHGHAKGVLDRSPNDIVELREGQHRSGPRGHPRLADDGKRKFIHELVKGVNIGAQMRK